MLYFVQRLRDEAHRFAIGSHRQKRKKDIREAGLQEIPGIGPTRKRALLHHFGTLKAIERASVADLEHVPGINAETARKIYDFFHETAPRTTLRDRPWHARHSQRGGCARMRAKCSFRPMTTTTNPTIVGARALALPNLLTYGRIAAVPVVVGCMYWQAILEYGLWLRWVALFVFIAAGHDRRARRLCGARIWGSSRRFGRMLDPIADKLLVSSCLLMLAADGTIRGWSLWAAIVILCREILVSGLREYLAELRVSVPVTALAKWKTFLQLLAVGFLHRWRSGRPDPPDHHLIGIGLLWLSAILTLYTGWDYFRAGVQHLIDD